MTRGTYIGWVGHGNLGDELMWRVCRSRFPQISWSHRDVSPPPRFSGLRRRLANATLRNGPSAALLGGGTLINSSPQFLALYREVRRQVNRPVPVFGAGVMDPAFWSRAHSGFCDQRKPWIEAMSDLPLLGVRGPLSKMLLEDAGAQNVIVCGDPCALTHERPARPQPATGRIAVNCGLAHGGMFGTQEDVERRLAVAVWQLVRAGLQVKLVAAWPRDREACARVAQIAGLRRPEIVRLTPRNYAAQLRECDAVIAFKLHVGIAAAALNLPFLLLEYRPKCRDFAQSISWERWTVRTDRLEADRVFSAMQDILSSRLLLQAELCAALCRLKRSFEDYCAAIDPLLAPSV